MLEFNEEKVKDLVCEEIIMKERIRWKTDPDGNLFQIYMHTPTSTFTLFWFDVGNLNHVVLFDARQQKIIIKNITNKLEFDAVLSGSIKNMVDLLFTLYDVKIHLSDDYKKISNPNVSMKG